MQDIIKRDILSVLNELLEILKVEEESDVVQVRALSNHVIHNSSVFQDEDSVSVAVLIYSLSKIMERNRKNVDYNKVSAMISACAESLKNSDDLAFRESVKKMFDLIRSIDRKLNLYIHEVINKARINKGCKLCEHGISVARSSEVLGISQWELMHYMGKTTLVDQSGEPASVSGRLKIARSLFS